MWVLQLIQLCAQSELRIRKKKRFHEVSRQLAPVSRDLAYFFSRLAPIMEYVLK